MIAVVDLLDFNTEVSARLKLEELPEKDSADLDESLEKNSTWIDNF